MSRVKTTRELPAAVPGVWTRHSMGAYRRHIALAISIADQALGEAKAAS
jgi:hypothetical protein